MTVLTRCSLRSFGFRSLAPGVFGIVFLASVLGTLGCATTGGGADGPEAEAPPVDAIGDRPTSVPGVTLKSYGIPNRHLKNTTVALLDPGAGPDASILQGTHTHGEGRMVRFQPSTGEITYLPMRGALGSWAIASNGDGSAYAGSHQTGYVFHLEAGADSLRRIEVPRPTELAYDWVFSIAEASDGWYYFGTYPEGALLRYSPDSHIVEEFGQLIEDTNRAQYVRHLNARFDGKIYAGLGAVPELIEIDLATQEQTAMLPPRYRDRSFVYVTSRFRDMLLAVVSPNDRLLFFDPSSRELIRDVAPPDGSPGFMRFASDSFVTYNDRLLFGTADDDRLWEYDFDQDEMRLIAEGVGAPIGLAADHFLFCVNSASTYTVIDLRAGETLYSRPTMFEGGGMQMHAINEGPDGDVMGGIYINQGFFRHFLDPDSLLSPGTSVTFGGQIDQLVAHRDKIYLAHYTSARLSVYDPAHAWNPGRGSDANPRVLGSIHEDQDRFPAMVVGPDDQIYLGSIPKYGKLGGALVVFDPRSESWTVHRDVVPAQSVLSLVSATDGLIYGGTGITGGLGSTPSATEAHLFAWDPASHRLVRSRPIVPGAKEIWGLDELPDGRLIGTADSALFVYDPTDDSVVAVAPGVPETIKKIDVSRDGWVYGLNEYRLFRFSPDLQTVQILDAYDGYWDSLVELRDGRLFVARGAELMEILREPNPDS